MATQITMPQMGADMKEGTVVRWIKKEGDKVAKGDPLAEIETDKAVVEVEAFASGILRRISVGEGKAVPVGQVIGLIGTPDEVIPEASAIKAAPISADDQPSPAPSPSAATSTRAPTTPATPDDGRIKASPLAKREAENRGIDLARVMGSGPAGRITQEDVVNFASKGAIAAATPSVAVPGPAAKPASTTPPAPAKPAAPDTAAPPSAMTEDLIPLNKMRQAIAAATTRSTKEIPQFFTTIDIDMTEAMKLRSQLNKALEGDVKVSVNDMVIKASVKSLLKHPHFNASYTEKGIQYHKEINISIAVALNEGLIAPSISDCAGMSLAEIARSSGKLVERARTGVLSTAEYSGGTFSVSNLGMFGVEQFTSIITAPQSGSLAVGAVRKAPVVRDSQVVAIDAMKVTLSTDHRTSDGAQAAKFLQDLKTYLESPLLLLA